MQRLLYMLGSMINFIQKLLLNINLLIYVIQKGAHCKTNIHQYANIIKPNRRIDR